MAIKLLTGCSGTDHINSEDDGALNASIVGSGSYVFEFGDNLAAEMTTSNKVTIGTGCLMHQGRKAWCESPTELTIDSGGQGVNRNDLVVARYTRVNTGAINKEDMELVVVKGTATSGTAQDPAINNGSILDGAATSDMPLWRIPIRGITPGDPVPLFETLPSVDSLRETISQQTVRLGSSIVFTRIGDIGILNCDQMKINQEKQIVKVGTLPNGITPAGAAWTEEDDAAYVAPMGARGADAYGQLMVNRNGDICMYVSNIYVGWFGCLVFPISA